MKWTDEEVEFLKENYPTKGLQYCVDKLGRSADVVRSKAYSINLHYGAIIRKTNIQITKLNMPIIIDYIESKSSLMETAAKLNISPNEVITIANKLKEVVAL